MIVIDDISKKFYNQVLFENFSYSITSFGLYAIYGENGSGKTTLLKILARKAQPSSGKVVISEKSCYVDSIYPIFSELTIYENLKIVCEDENRIKDGLIKFNIHVDLNKKAKTCSKGEKARIAILRAFLLNSYIILLDEPLANLDNQTAKLVYQNLKQLSLERIIIFTTNYEEDLKQCDAVLRINNKHITIDENTNLKIQPSLNQDIKTYYDKRIIYKLIWSKGTFIMFWIEILIFAITCIFAGLLGYDKKQILSTGYMYTEDNYKVVINEKMDEEFITEEQLYLLQNKFDSSIIWVDSNFFKLTNVLSKNSSLTDCFYYPTFQHAGIRMIIVNSSRFELKDNEIVLSDYLYAMFDHFKMIENERLSLNGLEYQIKEIYSTNYLDYFDFYISKVNNKDPLNYAINFYERNKDIYKCLSEYYSKIYISKSMAEVIKHESLKNYKIRGFEIKFLEELQSNEIILPKSLLDNYKIGDSYLVGTDIFSGSYQIKAIAQDEYFYLSES